ncbi:MAG: SEC-C domain-containing protein [Deltaproteobacteria bacterium]|nr:SEC-C domain-containing protein [Deltaproteobacteria bacterium]
MKFEIRPKDKCPCGSGKEYRKCHSPKRDRSDNNIWKGPGHNQIIYFGHKDPLTGIWFDKSRKGEFKLLKGNDRVPVARFFCVDDTILACKAIVRYLSVSVDEGIIKYTGSLEVQKGIQIPFPVLIGCIDAKTVEAFGANLSGRPVSYERGDWVIFIGEDENPIARIKKQPRWLRYLRASGFLVESETAGEINFSLSTKAKGFNLFTLALPFGEIEIPHPQVSVTEHQATCQLDIEKENVSWDLVLHQDIFSERKRSRKDSKVYIGYKQGKNIIFDTFDKSIRKHVSNPIKIRLGISIPGLSATIGKFAESLERTIRTISENGGFRFDEKGNRILEADFRDHVLTVLKSIGYYAMAEPTRKKGFVDILLKKDDSEGIIEFKVWGRRRYKDVIKQVLDYGTPWTTEYATVMINPNRDPVTDKFIENARKSPGLKNITKVEHQLPTLNKLISCHYLPDWDKHIAITHFILNIAKL